MRSVTTQQHSRDSVLVTAVFGVCLIAGIVGIVFSALGPNGWLYDVLKNMFIQPSWGMFATVFGAVFGLVAVKHLVDRPGYNRVTRLLVGSVAVVGAVFLVQAVRVTIL